MSEQNISEKYSVQNMSEARAVHGRLRYSRKKNLLSTRQQVNKRFLIYGSCWFMTDIGNHCKHHDSFLHSKDFCLERVISWGSPEEHMRNTAATLSGRGLVKGMDALWWLDLQAGNWLMGRSQLNWKGSLLSLWRFSCAQNELIADQHSYRLIASPGIVFKWLGILTLLGKHIKAASEGLAR